MYFSYCVQSTKWLWRQHEYERAPVVKTIFNILDRRPYRTIWRLTLLMVLGLSVLMIWFGKAVFVELFFVFPVILASWYGSRNAGVGLALTTTGLLLGIHVFHAGLDYFTLLSYGLPCAISFSLLAVLITNFRNVHRVEATAADTDNLTKLANSRGFYAELANELLRSSRYEHIFSLAFLDIDNFKRVNDTFGHAEGDRLLKAVAKSLKESLRASDTVARLGGDEFACLLPETSEDAARVALTKAQQALQRRMQVGHWPVSASIGLVTFETLPVDIKQAMKVADDLMYSVKRASKNAMLHEAWHGPSGVSVKQVRPAELH